MKQLIVLISAFAAHFSVFAQQEAGSDSSWKKQYRETAPMINDLVHTKLAVSFDYDKSFLYGKAWITLKPHFYPTDSLTLDAKGMEFKTVAIVKGSANIPLKYEYDGMQLHIHLGRTISRNEKYIIYIDYTAKPNEYKGVGSAAITDAKGLYFINPKGEEKDKPTQIWTQGETEATSVWTPTIDNPNQKTTDEIAMTVPSKYLTLSNGKLIAQKKNVNGTRTDTWKMDLPHAPYLFFMGVGEYSVIKDLYKGKEVNYYVEKEYASVARKIFGNTPEMMGFFSKILGVEYPWNKYAQITGRDYVSGAMENTTATLHQESAQQDARALIDGNIWEGTIAHELFHQWFGDLVTSESWSNITLNESFANYSEVLWMEHKYGKDAGDEENFKDMQGYLRSESDQKKLVRYYYNDKEAMFDPVSYNKGGRILNMLRNYVGDSAFFKALNVYLVKNKFTATEAHQLRLAFEEVTGKDLNWFWNQWYFGAGHPKLTIDYVYDDNAKNVQVIVQQTQDGPAFRLPIAVDIYNGSKKTRYKVWLGNQTDTLRFNYSSRPDLVNVDADKILLVEKTDNKSLDNFIHQYTYAGTYLDRKEAIDFAAASKDPKAIALMKKALKDPFFKLRTYTLGALDMKDDAVKKEMEPVIADLAVNDPKSLVKAAAIILLPAYEHEKYKSVFVKGTNDSSYAVSGAALEGLSATDSVAAFNEAKKMIASSPKGKLLEAIAGILKNSDDENDFDLVADIFAKMPLSQAQFDLIKPLGEMIVRLDDTEKVKKGIDLITGFRDDLPEAYGFSAPLNQFLTSIMVKKESDGSASSKEQAAYIRSKIDGK